jgi:hypothetical protein
VNLAALAAGGATLLEQAIATSGTTVTISRDSDDQDETVDLDTLAVSDPTSTDPIATDVAALIVTTAATDVPVGTDRSLAEPTFRVFFPVTVTDVQQNDVLTVTASRDTQLTGAQLLVTAVLPDALGVRRQLEARRR